MTPVQKAKSKKHLVNKYATNWAKEVAARTGYTPHYVRLWFRTDRAQPKIQKTVIDLVHNVKAEQRQIEELVS